MLNYHLPKTISIILLAVLLLAMPGWALAAAADNLAVVTPADGSELPAENTPADADDTPADSEPADENAITTPPELPDSLTVWLYDAAISNNRRVEVTPVSLSLNGSYLPSDVPAMAISGRTLVPVRVISESLDATVDWSKADNTVTITLGNKTIILTIGESQALVNGQTVAVPDNVSVSLVTYEGAARTMVPVRFVTETLAAACNYDAATRNVDIIPSAGQPDDDDQTAEPEPPAKPVGVDENGNLYRRVVIDAGHGGADPGTNGGGYDEKNITLSVSLKVQALLEAAGYEVIMSRTGDTYPELTERAALTSEFDAPVFVSIHCNAAENIPTASGIETYAAPDDAADAELAEYLQKRLIAATAAKDRGVKTSRLVVLTHNLAPAALVELGFMSNAEECAKLASESYQQTLAQAICAGIEDYFAAH